MTKTDICNRALGILGHDRFIEDYETDTSTEAERCRQLYPTALSHLLYAHEWDFATEERAIALGLPMEDGACRIPIPDDCARLIGIYDGSGEPLKVKRVRGKSAFVWPRGEGYAKMRYISNDLEVDELPPPFVEALEHRLAHLLCAPMFGDPQRSANFLQLADAALSRAKAIEANETRYCGDAGNKYAEARR